MPNLFIYLIRSLSYAIAQHIQLSSSDIVCLTWCGFANTYIDFMLAFSQKTQAFYDLFPCVFNTLNSTSMANETPISMMNLRKVENIFLWHENLSYSKEYNIVRVLLLYSVYMRFIQQFTVKSANSMTITIYYYCEKSNTFWILGTSTASETHYNLKKDSILLTNLLYSNTFNQILSTCW